jgi:hypothetical protein
MTFGTFFGQILMDFPTGFGAEIHRFLLGEIQMKKPLLIFSKP